jgi:itaconyl-CoA hydratase
MVIMIGRYLEEFSIGENFITPKRTIHTSEVIEFCNLTWFNLSAFFDDEYIKNGTVWGKNVVPGPFIISLGVGLFIKMGLYEKTVIALLGIENMKFDNPLIIGETMFAEVEILEIRKSKKHPDKGIMRLLFTIKKNEGKFVMSYEMYHMLKCKPKK